ncbi:hypothetical protein [Barnesiella intestinihominis]|jgi:hypothetical protein|uniref:hypothetical protein n=1 Tax=Barnesiella intestinihominis TaxID=487174 RepID=UPI00242CDAFC|nr:hypothetical protein [Barnesiella intestinihominis]
MKIKNKYNIGDYVWVMFCKGKPTRHKIDGIKIHIYPDNIVSIFYQLEGTSRDIIGFPERECFLTKDECTKNKTYGAVKGTAIRLSSVFARLYLIIAMMLFSVPLLIIQVIHWLFTGRREPVTYRIMDKITDKLDNG